jgi:hypothetical protein
VRRSLTSALVLLFANPAGPAPTITVIVNDLAGTPPGVVTRAELQTTRIFLQIGIATVWQKPDLDSVDRFERPPSLDPIHRLAIRMIIQPRFRGRRDDRLRSEMGAAMASQQPCGGSIDLFFDRIVDVAGLYHLDPALVLGHVAAHEIGHRLLGKGHAREGLMRSPWSARDFERATLGLLLFTAPDVETIRGEAAACERISSSEPSVVIRR